MSNRIRLLNPADSPQTLALSQIAGWDQTEDDWRLAIHMNPEGCFAIEHDGSLVATTTSIRYRTKLAWIGMVLTHPGFRGRGFAASLMEQVLDHLSGIETIKLDATEMGEPLYRKFGFVPECPIERWVRKPSSFTPPPDNFTPMPALDLEAFGADRGALLERLSQIESASTADGFAMSRGPRFGPCVSRSKESALLLAKQSSASLWDLFPDTNLAKDLGFQFFRRLTRMTKGRALAANQSLIYAGAGFEFG